MRTLFWKTVACGIFLFVLSGQVFAFDQEQLRAYESLFLADTGCNDPDTLLRKSGELSGRVSLDNPAPEAFLSGIRLGILYHNLSLHGAEKGHRGYAEKAADILSKLYHIRTYRKNFGRSVGHILVPVWPWLGGRRLIR